MAAQSYNIYSPSEGYKGLSFNDLMAAWTNWLVSPNAYYNNNGDPVFVASVVPCDQPGYINRTLVMAGNQRLVLPIDRAIFFMAIGSIFESVDNSCPDNEAARRGYVNRDLDAGGPPSTTDILIDGSAIQLPAAGKMEDYRIVSRDFTLNVPQRPYIGQCLDIPVTTPGARPCCTGGYCFLLKFNTGGSHSIRLHCKGAPWEGGVYFTDSFHEIFVPQPTARFADLLAFTRKASNQFIKDDLDRRVKSGELTQPDADALKKGL